MNETKLLRVQVNLWLRPEGIERAAWNLARFLEIGRGDGACATVGELYLDNVCDVLGIEKPEPLAGGGDKTENPP